MILRGVQQEKTGNFYKSKTRRSFKFEKLWRIGGKSAYNMEKLSIKNMRW